MVYKCSVVVKVVDFSLRANSHSMHGINHDFDSRGTAKVNGEYNKNWFNLEVQGVIGGHGGDAQPC